jgi:hypothetical protein
LGIFNATLCLYVTINHSFRTGKSLKELQINFYELATQNQQQKASLIQAQLNMYNSISNMCQVQTELMAKMSSVLDKVATNFCNK